MRAACWGLPSAGAGPVNCAEDDGWRDGSPKRTLRVPVHAYPSRQRKRMDLYTPAPTPWPYPAVTLYPQTLAPSYADIAAPEASPFAR
jgi:hypothetical protein